MNNNSHKYEYKGLDKKADKIRAIPLLGTLLGGAYLGAKYLLDNKDKVKDFAASAVKIIKK